MKEAVIVSAVRTAVGKAPKGTLKNTRPDDLGAAAIKEAVERVEGLDKAQVEDVIMGCAFPEAEQGMKDTTPLQARKGRASYLGERSIGHQDPGATSSYLILNALLETLEE